MSPQMTNMPKSANQEEAIAIEDEEDYMPDDLIVDQNEIMLRKRQKCGSNVIINCVCIKREAKLQLKIPLCRLRALPLMRPINEVDMQQMENEFITSYRNGDQVLYVLMYNDKAKSLDVYNDISDS